ncbi:hypothetical protein AAFF_G00429210 [Aldrovandia affinis]|uniref:Uncharacterized protein n=1 Tax=Aldrovandia affinis TaxID=143900 RepID=A0AAD7WIK9_9TELE|nr:hypothetical protein AAFF_G00429210 [Aldrovandia affinis]
MLCDIVTTHVRQTWSSTSVVAFSCSELDEFIKSDCLVGSCRGSARLGPSDTFQHRTEQDVTVATIFATAQLAG